MSFDLELAGRRALVSGGTKGVGAAVVEALRDAGAQVLAAARALPPVPVEGVRFVAADLSTAHGASASRMLDKKRYAAEPLDNTATFLSLRS